MNNQPKWINVDNYELRPCAEETRKQGKNIYECIIDHDKPLTFWDGQRFIQFDRHFMTDLGSIPRQIQSIRGFEMNRWERSFLGHDSMYKHHVYFCNGITMAVTQEQADKLLFTMIEAEGRLLGKEWLANLVKYPIYWAVKAFGCFAWGNK